ncbi:MAG TPA: T9SS C-terminal target domain-containing protein, partial [Bacteroidetes bacterium]|nr:T9SS C-terminal target domain-containing protein [Bacteroidota bacterium]
KIYSMTGQEVAELISSDMDAGEYSLNFSGLKLSSGSYVYRLTAGEFTDSKIMTLIK